MERRWIDWTCPGEKKKEKLDHNWYADTSPMGQRGPQLQSS